MLKNYLKIALRNVRRNPVYALINVMGLALGIACCLLIGLYVQDERSYDRHHENGDRIYRINQQVERPGAEELWAWAGAGLANDLRADFPAVEAVVRFHQRAGIVRYAAEDDPAQSRNFREEDFFFTDPAVFDVFSHVFIQGDPTTALMNPGSVVLSRSTATRYFGEADPMGKTLTYDARVSLQVTGVIEDVPKNSHLRFDMLAPLAAFKQHHGLPAEAPFGSYWWPACFTYALLPDAAAAAQLEAQLPDFVARHREPQAASMFIPTLEPLFDIHLLSEAESGPSAGGSQAMVNIFTLIAIAILVLACINFMNLSTARAAKRAREVGVRKCIGAHRTQLIVQFLGESMLLSLLALLFAIALVEVLLPLFNDLAAKDLAVGYAENKAFWLGLVGLIAFTGLVAGSYPALVLSGFSPARTLKGTFSKGGGSVWLRKGLVVFQFTVSVALIAGTLIAASQIRYLQNKDLGFDDEQIVTLRLPGDGTSWDALRGELLNQSEVLDVTATTVPPGFGRGGSLPYEVEGEAYDEDDQPQIGHQQVDYGFFEMLGIEFVAGRSFSPDRPADEGTRPDTTTWLYHIFDRGLIINETAARRAGWTPEEALGKKMRVYAYENGTYYTDIRGAVVGVVRDYHYNPLNYEIRPAMFSLARSPMGSLVPWGLVKVAPGNAAETMETLRTVWQRMLPDQPFEASFLDQDLDNRYVQEARVGKIIGAFAFLGLAIACLGLFGLAAYAAEQRTKEIGIRKAMGASVPNIVGLLSREFLTLVSVATLLAVPIAYFAMEAWLQDFAYRVEISWPIFLMTGLTALGVALATVSFQSIKAALTDPVKALRYE